MKSLYVQGKYTWCCDVFHFRETRHVQPFVGIIKGGRQIAMLYYHEDAKRVVLNVLDGMTVTKECLKWIDGLHVWDFRRFRLTRRYWNSMQRNKKKEKRNEPYRNPN